MIEKYVLGVKYYISLIIVNEHQDILRKEKKNILKLVGIKSDILIYYIFFFYVYLQIISKYS